MDDPNVDELRDKLRRLGYLDAGVNRFVLAPARHGRSGLAIAAASSVRVGVLAGVLLGPAAAVGLSVRLPSLVTGVRDAIVIAMYLGVLFGVGAALAAFIATIVTRFGVARSRRAAGLLRRPTLAAGIVGAVVGAASLVYLALWWNVAGAADQTVWAQPGWTALALAVAAGASLLLGRAASLTAVAAIAGDANPDMWSADSARQRRSWTFTAALAVLAFAGASALLYATSAPAAPAALASVDFAVVPTGLRVIVVGIDGFDPLLADRLRASGQLPRLHRLLSGATAKMPTAGAQDPAQVWTSIATGQPAEAHGVTSIETRRVSGVGGTVDGAERWRFGSAFAAAADLLRLTRPAIASGAQRREKTLWEVAAEKGLRTAVVNWWATWPADRAAGIVISDRAVLRLERGGPLDAEMAPSDLYDALRADWSGLRDAARARARAAFPAENEAAAVLRRSAELDAILAALASHPRVGRLDLLAIYLPGLDIAQHEILSGPSAAGLPASALASRVELLEQYYRFLDGIVSGVIGESTAGELVAIVASPGRVSGASSGVFALSGGGTSHAAIDARAADVAPTLLYALGLPTSAELAGAPLTGLFGAEFVRAFPVRTTASYGRRGAARDGRGPSTLDEEMVERLRSLGYVR